MTPQQLQTLKSHISAETDATFSEFRANGQTDLMARWYNQDHQTVRAWNKATSWGAVFDSINGADYTPTAIRVNAATDAASTNKLLLNLLKLQIQQNYLLAMQSIDARNSGTVDALLDSVSNVYTLNGTNQTNPGGAGGANAAIKMTRAATRAENVFGGTDVLKGGVTAKILSWEGQLTGADISAALEA